MSSNPDTHSTTWRRLLTACIAAVAALVLANAAALSRHGLWRFAGYPFDVAEFWPEALRVGRTLEALPRRAPPRWVVIGSSIVLYGAEPATVEDAAGARGGTRPSVGKLAVPRAVFTDAFLLTQLARNQTGIEMAVVGVHPRDFDVTEDPRTTLVAHMFDHAGLEVAPLEGGPLPRRVERHVAYLWPAFRTRQLQARVVHALVGAPLVGRDEQAFDPGARPWLDPAHMPLRENRQLDQLEPWMRWCRERGVHPVLVYFPERPGDPAPAWSHQLGNAWIAMLETRVADGQGSFINARDVMPADRFFDFNHLTEDGAVEFSTWLGERLAEIGAWSAPA